MIKNWEAQNFKAITQASLELGKLNVILGKNSVGKSSLIQSIISTSQYFGNQYPSAKFSFIGNAQDLGPANFVKNREAGGRNLSFTVQFTQSPSLFDGRSEIEASLADENSDEMSISKIAFQPSATAVFQGGTLTCEFKAPSSGQQLRFYTFQPSLKGPFLHLGESSMAGEGYRDSIIPSRLGTSEGQSNSPAWLEMHLLVLARQMGMSNSPVRATAARMRTESGLINEMAILGAFMRAVAKCRNSKNPEKSAYASAPDYMRQKISSFDMFEGFSALLAHKDQVARHEKQHKKFFKQAKNTDPYLRTQIPPMPTAPQNPNLVWAALVYLVALDEIKRQQLFPEFDYLFVNHEITGESTLDRFFSTMLHQTSLRLSRRVKYLGPMRAVHPSEQRNGRSPSTIVPLGRGGEYLAHYLHTNHSTRGVFCLPSGPKDTSLGKALDAWLNFFEIGTRSSTASSTWGATEYLLDGERTNQKGTGVSQVLPVILVALLAAKGELLILEQPELHLHPAHQRKLADLLVAFSEHGVQILAETHSEYLVTRLRLLIATGKIDGSDAKIIFAQSKGTKKTKQVDFKVSNIDNLGKIDFWPEGFFEESLEDRLLLSSIQFAAED